MSGPTRPIPISQGRRSQRSSPISDADGSDRVSPISQSCPVVNGHGAAFYNPRHVPPRAPVIGSLPEPSFMLGGADGDDMMPELVLPPPAQEDASATRRREASVVQVASSCPVDIGFFRQGSPAQPRSWIPSPRASDEFDLSKSPALAVMSAMRQARRPSFESRRAEDDPFAQSHDRPPMQDQQPQARSFGIARRISDPFFRPQPSNSFVSTSHPFFGDDRISDDHGFGMENLSLNPDVHRTTFDDAPGLPPRRPERRGSYDGGIFHFDDDQ